jgi:cardiolipin synthase
MHLPQWLIFGFGLIYPLIELIGIYAAGRAIMTSRTPQGSVAWAVSLVTMPLIALPLYIFAGSSRFEGYISSRRKGDDRIESIYPELQKDLLPFAISPERLGANEDFLGPARHLSDLPVTTGNQVKLYVNGERAFEQMFQAIEDAQSYLLVFFFIVKDDALGLRFRDALMKKARSGVDVYLAWDSVGSRQLPRNYADKLTDAGVRVESFQSTQVWSRFQLNFRNHRKILIADGEVAFVGGMNIGDEYLGSHPKFGTWRDTHLRLKGPSVTCLQIVFLEDWHWMTGEIPDNWRWKPKPHRADFPVLIAPTAPVDPLDSAQLLFVSAAHTARQRLWIASPYFVPDVAMVAALQATAIRGVDVRILLPDRPDHLLPYLSSFAYYPDMLGAGVKLFRYSEGFMHQKALLIDDRIASIGTANLDNRSFRLNFEIFAFVADPEFVADVEKMLTLDFCRSREVELGEFSKRELWFRAACRLSRLMAPLQ